MSEDLAQITRSLSDEWLLFLESEGIKPKTRTSYLGSLRRYLEFLSLQGIRYDSVGFQIVTRWKVWMLRERNMKPRSLNTALSAIRSFYRWLRISNYIHGDPLQDIRCVKAPRLLPKPISEPWVKKILRAAGNMEVRRGHNGRARALGDVALFETFYASGGRISQLQGMNIGDVDFKTRTILTFGKGKEVVVHFGKHAAQAIGKWLSFRNKRGEKLQSDSPLWVGARWKRMDKKTMRRHLREAAARAGYQEKIWPHRLRHSFFTHLLDHGADLREAQELGGHDNIVSTQIYTEVSTSRLRRAFREAHPRA